MMGREIIEAAKTRKKKKKIYFLFKIHATF